MKKLSVLILLTAMAWASRAQVATFTVTTTPCHNDGVLSVAFTGVTPPLVVNWTTYGTSGTTITHRGVSGPSDILTGYSGGPISITAVGPDSVYSTGYFYGAPPFTYSDSTFSAICPALGTIQISVGGGTAPYTYYWYNRSTLGAIGTVNPISVPTGAYGVTITDAHGCTFGSTVNNDYLYLYNTPPFYDSIFTTVANCTNGSATASPVGGGVAPFSYLWSNGATSPSITGLVMGGYSVRITDANGCSDSSSAEVTQSVTISVPVTATPATCIASDGAVIAFGSGGMSPYTYSWSNGATTQSQTGLAAGAYAVTATDANGCFGYGYGYVNVSTPIVVTYTTTPSMCTSPTGTATLTISGGTGSYSVVWGTYPVQTGNTATALTYGFYNFEVTDAVGCRQSGTVYIPPIDVISVNFTDTPALCMASNGSMTAYPVGGVAPYTYLWSTGSGTNHIASQPAGGYTLRITDALGCVVNKYPYLSYVSPLGVGLYTTPASCIFTNDGTDSARVWGATGWVHYSWSNGGITQAITGLPTGPYWLTVSDSLGCVSETQYSYVPYDTATTSCYCTINGTVFTDYNNNCLQDAGEPGIPNVQIQISGKGYTYTDASGNYTYKVPSGTYTVSENVLAFYPLSPCQANNLIVSATAASGCVHTVNFANNVDTIHDMHISTWNYYSAQPVIGHPYTQVVLISNDGTVPEDSVDVIYHPDGQILAPTSVVPSGDFSGMPYYYTSNSTFPTLAPGTHQRFLVNYSVPTDIPLGTPVIFKDSVSYKAPITNWLTDYSPWNNTNLFTATTVGSFDPNFKEVLPQGTGANGTISYTDSVLEYMVHFQNTGTFQAQNITVIDTLDNNLNAVTLRPEYESGNCYVTLTQVGTNNIVKFYFQNINLPAEQFDTVGSNGMLTYTIHLNRGLAVGTQIKNHASIYFDYNAPVMTNSTLNTIGTSDPHVGVNPLLANSGSFEVYPNPAGNSFTASINSAKAGTGDLVISDITGRVVEVRKLNIMAGLQTVHMDVSQLASGSYFVTYTDGSAAQTQKLVILK